MGKSSKRKSGSGDGGQSTAAKKGRTRAPANTGSKRSSPPRSTAAKKSSSSPSPQAPQTAGKKRPRPTDPPPSASESAKAGLSWEEFVGKYEQEGIDVTVKAAREFFEELRRKDFKPHHFSGLVKVPKNWRAMYEAKLQWEDVLTEESYSMVVS